MEPSSRLKAAVGVTFAPAEALRAIGALEPDPTLAAEIERSPAAFQRHLAELLVVSPPMSDALRAHPDWLSWLRDSYMKAVSPGSSPVPEGYGERWKEWASQGGVPDGLEGIRAFKRREFLLIAFLDVAGLLSFQQTVRGLSALADLVLDRVLNQCWLSLAPGAPARLQLTSRPEGFAVFALGKLGASELNYSSDIDLSFCRRACEDAEEARFYTRLAERLVQEFSRFGPEGALYRVDMRLRPHGDSGDLVPTVTSLLNYYESWGEAWEKQALIKLRFVAGDHLLGRRFGDFAARFTFARQIDDAALEELKRVKHRSEREYAQPGDRFHVKQGAGGIRDIEFYVQHLQLIAGPGRLVVRAASTLDALNALEHARALIEGELTRLSLAYIFLRTVEHRLQLRGLTPQAVLPNSADELQLLARGLGFAAAENLQAALAGHRRSVRDILERVYLAPGFLRPSEREEEFAQLLTERTPKDRIRQLLSQFGFQDIEKAWQNIRLIGLGPAGRMLPPGERRAFLQLVYPLLEVLRDSIDPDQALHNLESFLTAAGNRLSFLRTLASKRPHLMRLANLLALSNLSHQILSRHPEYFDALARGVHLHEGRTWQGMLAEIQDRAGASPRGESRENVLRRFRQREMIRVAYRDVAGLADPVAVSTELAHLAEACLRAAVYWTRLPNELPAEYSERLHPVGLGKFGAGQMHYSSDLDLVFLYDPPGEAPAEERARAQMAQDGRVESVLHLLGSVTPGGLVYRIDLRLRPEGGAGFLSRSWSSFLDHARQFMQPWERMALVRSRVVSNSTDAVERWRSILDEVVYGFRWDDNALASIRHLKRRIETEKNKESRSRLDFKYGRGGIVDLEFLVQFLQIRHGAAHPEVRSPSAAGAVPALCACGAISETEQDLILRANRFGRNVENHYQLIDEWAARDISRDSPVLIRLARSLGYSGDSPADARRRFLADWDETAQSIRLLVEKHFYGA